MGGLVVQHNLAAMNALKNVNINLTNLQKSTAKLSSGFAINCAADNAAGLAISEKMRAQIRGLNQAVKNANDAISLIQTAEGGLNESHSILQRMRELAVQSANGTYTDDDRAAIQLEIDALKDEIDRISGATEFNTMKLLDGSLSGKENGTDYGALYGEVVDGAAIGGGKIAVTSNVAGTKLAFTVGASGKGGENAVWSSDGKTVTVNLCQGVSYTDKQIQKLIDNATVPKDGGMTNPYGKVTFKSEYGIIQGAEESAKFTGTAAGIRQTGTLDISAVIGNGGGAIGSSDTITFTANTYGKQADYANALAGKIGIIADVAKGKEYVDYTAAADGEATIHLATGVKYSEKDIESLLKKAGLDYSVTLTDAVSPDGSKDGYVLINSTAAVAAVTMTGGAGVGKSTAAGAGEGLVFQIGANGSEDQQLTLYIDDMGASALGIANIDVTDRDKANEAIDVIDNAIKKVSMQRAALGAQHNRLEYTVNSLTTAAENLTDAESRIRDCDMASEMIKYTKANILFQAAQAMLAQAMQQPQSVLQLLG